MGIRSGLFLFYLLFLCYGKVAAQDTIVFEGKHLYVVDIEEERERNVIFKKWDLEKSPTYVLEKRFITDIRYHNPDSAAQKFNPDPLYAHKPLELWIVPMDTKKVYRGEIDVLTDSSIVFKSRQKSVMEEGSSLPSSVDVFKYHQIRTVAVRRRDRMRKMAMWGGATGFTAGTLLGLLLFEDAPPCDPGNIDGTPCDPSLSSPRTKWEKALLLGAGGGGVGFLGGGLIGSAKVRIPIQGRKDAYQAAIPRLERLSRNQ